MANQTEESRVMETRQKAIQSVLKNIRQFGVPDAPGFDGRFRCGADERSMYRLSGTNLLRACAYTREHPLSDGRFIHASSVAKMQLKPSPGTEPLLIESLTPRMLHRFYPAERIPDFPADKEEQPLEERMMLAASFLSSKGYAPEDATSAESILDAFKRYGLDMPMYAPEEERTRIASMFAWMAMRESGIPYDASLRPMLTERDIEEYESDRALKDESHEETRFGSAFCEANGLAGLHVRNLAIFRQEFAKKEIQTADDVALNNVTQKFREEVRKSPYAYKGSLVDLVNSQAEGPDPFDGFRMILHWNEGMPLHLPEKEIALGFEENQVFWGRDAYELLAALILRDRQQYRDRIRRPGYDKCKVSLYFPGKGQDLISFDSERIDLGDMELGGGKMPFAALEDYLGGRLHHFYEKYPERFSESFYYKMMTEDAKERGENPPSPRLALEQMMSQWEETMDALRPFVEQEEAYLAKHPKLSDALKDVPEPYYFLCKKEEVPATFSFIEIKDAEHLDGFSFRNGIYLTADLFSFLGQTGWKRQDMDVEEFGGLCDDAKGYVLISSAFYLAGEKRFKNNPFHPYVPRAQADKMRDFSKFELKVETGCVPGTSDYEVCLEGERRAWERNGKEGEMPSIPKETEIYYGTEAIKALHELCRSGKCAAEETINNGFSIPYEEKQVSLSCDGKEYLSVLTVPGKDERLTEVFGQAEKPYMGFPMPKDKADANSLWESMRTSIEFFSRIDDSYRMPSEVEYQGEKKFPSDEEARRNMEESLTKKAASFNPYSGWFMNDTAKVIEAYAREIIKEPRKAPLEAAKKNGVSEDELLGMAFAWVAARFQFKLDHIKNIIEKSRLTNQGKKKALSTLHIKAVQSLLPKGKKEGEQR